MWDDVRRELRVLEWDPEPPVGDSLFTEWSATVTTLLAARRAVAPITGHDDPFALLATATSGALRADTGEGEPGASLERVRAALNQGARAVADVPLAERGQHLANVTHVAYELVHWARIQSTDDRVRAWLLAGETAMDGAIHAPAARTPTGAGLAAWQGALATTMRDQDAAILQRGVAVGHLSILKSINVAIDGATRSGALSIDYGKSVLVSIRDLGLSHLATADALRGLPAELSREHQAVLLQLGTAARQLTERPDPLEDRHSRLDALLRSGFGHSALVAGLTASTAARAPADRLQRLALEYLANPRMLQRNTAAAAPFGVPTPARDSATPPSPSSTRGPIVATITPGTVLDADTVEALCRARDVGVAASVADPARPPEILRGTDPTEWPRLAADGQQAVADLVASVTPMVYALTRHELNREDLRGEMFVHLMRVAHTYDPSRTNAARWPRYAWETLQHLRWRGVDNAGVPRQRVAQPLRLVGLDGTDPVSRDARPDEVIVGRAGVEATMDAVNALPMRLREPLLLSMAGKTFLEIGDELGISSATAHRRTVVARRVLHRELGIGDRSDESSRPDFGSRRIPNQGSAETPRASSAATTPTWETIHSLPRRPAPTLGPAGSSPAPGIGW